MRFAFIACMCALVSNAFADEKVPVKDGFQALDMKGFEKVQAPEKKSGIKAEVGCMDSTGRNFRQGEAGFDTCVINRNTAHPTDKGSNLNIQFGK